MAHCRQVLGDRSLKLKYLNPNTMFLATGSTPGQPGTAHITAHIFDTITGRLLFSQKHEVRRRVLIAALEQLVPLPQSLPVSSSFVL